MLGSLLLNVRERLATTSTMGAEAEKLTGSTLVRLLPLEAGQPATNRKEQRTVSSWRVTVGLGTLIAFLVFAVNVGALVWIRNRFIISNGVATVFEGK